MQYKVDYTINLPNDEEETGAYYAGSRGYLETFLSALFDVEKATSFCITVVPQKSHKKTTIRP